MDSKAWLWKKRSAARTLVVADRANDALGCEEEKTEVQGLLLDKEELEKDIKVLNDKLSSALSECNVKDNIAKKQVKIAEDAIAGWEKAEIEATSLKKELDKVLKQKASLEERLANMDAALKECMQELRFVREEQNKKVHDAVMKTSEEYEKSNTALGEKLTEALKRLTKLEAENAQLIKAVSIKDKMIADLSKCTTQIEADFNALMLRVDTTKKENDSLKYEVRILQKELHIRNEERELHRRTADATEKHLLENAKRMEKLEAECQRLRMLVRKRLPGPSALTKVNNEIEVLGKDQAEVRRRKSSISSFSSITPSSDMGSEDKVSCVESWASALLSELEHFKNEKNQGTISNRNTMLASDMSLMDDFAEMEKLAVASVNNQAGCDGIIQTSTNKCPAVDAPDKIINCTHSNLKNSGNKVQHVSVSINKILELLEGINIKPQDIGTMECSSKNDNQFLPYKDSETSSGYIVRVFQWKSAEFATVLQQFVHICQDLLNGTVNLEQFVEQVASDLEWVVNHCFSLQDVSSMKESIINHLDWDESVTEAELAKGSFNFHGDSCQNKTSQPIIMEEFKTWNNELADRDDSVMELEARLQSEIVNGERLRTQLQESKTIIEKLQSEVESMQRSQKINGNQVVIEKMVKEDLEARVNGRTRELGKTCDKNSLIEGHLDDKIKSCQKLKEKCHDPIIKPERSRADEATDDEKHGLQNDLEIVEASEKLAKCQETILDLEKQLKSLSSPNDATIFDKLLSNSAISVTTSSSSTRKSTSKRSSLLDKMLAEDNAQLVASSRTTISECQKGISSSALSTNSTMDSWGKPNIPDEVDDHEENSKLAADSMDIVPCKKDGDRSFFKKLFRRRKKGNNGKLVS